MHRIAASEEDAATDTPEGAGATAGRGCCGDDACRLWPVNLATTGHDGVVRPAGAAALD